jgi:hypothetical protein
MESKEMNGKEHSMRVIVFPAGGAYICDLRKPALYSTD